MISFKKFLESSSYVSVDGRRDFTGNTHEMPDVVLTPPTREEIQTITGIKKLNSEKYPYRIYLNGWGNCDISSEVYNRKKDILKVGNRVKVTWYMYKKEKEKSYRIMSIDAV